MAALRAAAGSGGAVTGPLLWLVPAPEAGAPLDASVLDEGERARVAALRRPAERALYAAAHTAPRRLLGGCLGMAAAQVPLTRLACSALPCPGCGGPHGRPAVAGPPGEELHFSLSHSGGPALLAFAAARPVGADIERVPRGPGWSGRGGVPAHLGAGRVGVPAAPVSARPSSSAAGPARRPA
ncbi:hypothetical protein RB199_01985 [Streptomyces libani]